MSTTAVEAIKSTEVAVNKMSARTTETTVSATMGTASGSGGKPTMTRKISAHPQKKSRKSADSTCSRVRMGNFTRNTYRRTAGNSPGWQTNTPAISTHPLQPDLLQHFLHLRQTGIWRVQYITSYA